MSLTVVSFSHSVSIKASEVLSPLNIGDINEKLFVFLCHWIYRSIELSTSITVMLKIDVKFYKFFLFKRC